MTKQEWGAKSWPHLVELAKKRETLNYEDFGELIGLNAHSVGVHALDTIWQYCREEGYPVLTVLVVSKENGLPSDGAGVAAEDVPAVQEEVFAFDWLNDAKRPTPEDLAKYARTK